MHLLQENLTPLNGVAMTYIRFILMMLKKWTSLGRWLWLHSGQLGASTVPFKLRCYNCHEEGHYARNCTKPSINREQTPAQPVTPNRERALVTTSSITDDAATGSPQPLGLAQALVVQPDINFDWNSEIERLNISAPENQAASNNIAFMTSNDQVAVPEEEASTENLALMTQILSAPVKGLTKEEVRSLRTHSVKPLKLLHKKIKSIVILLLNLSQWASLMLHLVGSHWKL
ncbi:putative transcription factor interactor and regulator CCHC(Zn) family [Helianthus annuus]|nr:putative transcription factor interactor and regulator CCHC(Zn) family [Helianthus annuus]